MPAAGAGRRFGAGAPKQYAILLGRTVIEWALAPFLGDSRCAGVVVALAPDDAHWGRLPRERLAGVQTVAGGAERSHSVRKGLEALAGRAGEADWVLVHDAARPCLPREDLDRLLAECESHPVGGLLALPVADTVKQQTAAGTSERTIERTGLWRAQTPQMFRFAKLCAALDAAFAAGRSPTDEAQALEWLGAQPRLVSGSATNIKITSTADLPLAAALLGPDAAPTEEAAMKVGMGFDVHAFGAGEFVMLGGVRVPHARGVVAHSDGDVVLHALCDALLGAAGLGDIGQHFRDDDPQWRGADSGRFVSAILAMLAERGLAVVNADVTVIAQSPRLARYREEIRRTVAGLLGVPPGCVNLKATTTERLGFLGREEGIAAQAVVLLRAVRAPAQ